MRPDQLTCSARSKTAEMGWKSDTPPIRRIVGMALFLQTLM